MASTWAWMTAAVAAREYPSTTCMASGAAVITRDMTPCPIAAPVTAAIKKRPRAMTRRGRAPSVFFFLGRRGHRPQGKEGGSAKQIAPRNSNE